MTSSISTPPALAFDQVTHAYGGEAVVRDFTLTLAAGEVVGLLGPSGCGKTTVLRLAAGLEAVQQGQVRIAGEIVGDRATDVPPERRHVGLMFQDFALFPHLDVAANVAFGLKDGHTADAAQSWLKRVGLAARADAYPHQLSGGEQQRVALVRALAARPRVMLMDEPFSNLDTALRADLRRETLKLLRENGAASLLVTHDPDEAMAMADRLAVMREGKLVQIGTPKDLYARPANRFVASFLGKANFIPARVIDGMAATPFGSVAAGFADGTDVSVLVRPEALRIGPTGVAAQVTDARQVGGFSNIHLRIEGCAAEFEVVSLRTLPAQGETIRVTVDPALLVALPR